jgi:predicted MFS family arabinose efflux permease
MGITALGLVRARQLSQVDPRHTLAVMTAAFGLGQIVGPLFAGVVYDATGTVLVPSSSERCWALSTPHGHREDRQRSRRGPAS